MFLYFESPEYVYKEEVSNISQKIIEEWTTLYTLIVLPSLYKYGG